MTRLINRIKRIITDFFHGPSDKFCLLVENLHERKTQCNFALAWRFTLRIRQILLVFHEMSAKEAKLGKKTPQHQNNGCSG